MQTAIRAAFGAGVSLYLAQLLHLPFPLYAMISAVIVTDISPAGTQKLGIPRLEGTVIGAVVGVGCSMWLPATPFAIGLGILVAMVLASLLRQQAAAKLSGYICGIIMLSFNDDPATYALYRFLETALGIGVAMAVSFIPKLINSKPE